MRKKNTMGGAKRLSNIEALRLLSMLMILNLHSFWGYNYNHGNVAFQAFDFLRESTSDCAVNVFILISGYFGIKWKPKSFFNLIFQVLFYSFSVYGCAILFGVIEFRKSEFFNCFKAFCSSWGFIKWYMALYILSPILNSFAKESKNNYLILYIFILFIAENFIFVSFDIINFCLIYLIGRFIHKTEMDNKLKINATKAYWLTTFVIFIIVFLLYLKLHWGAERMCFFVFAFSYSSPFIILQSIFLFLIFSRFRFESRFINWCASSCLAIFLIHMHPAIKQIGYYSFTESLYERPVLEHILYLLLLMLIVFFGSIIIDKVRIVISDSCYKILANIYNKIPKKLVTFETYLPRKVLELV